MFKKAIHRRLPRVLLTCLICCVAAAGTASAATSSAPPLSVSAGSATATATKVKGSVTFHNAGPDGSGRFWFTLIAKLSGGDRLLRRAHENVLSPMTSRSMGFTAHLPDNLPIGRHQVWACAGKSPSPPEPSPKNGCRQLTVIDVPVPRVPLPSGGGGSGPGSSPSQPAPSSNPPASPPAPAPVSTVPTAPLSYTAGMPFVQNDAGNGYYWADVPAAYDATNQTPTALLVWLHGCGGESSGDIYTVSPETVGAAKRPRDWISIAVGGRDDDCWNVDTDQQLVQNAIADVEMHFNIDRHRVILGGYSSGGDLSYRLAFYNSNEFAGVLAENTSPFRDTGSTQAQSLAAATTKFHVVHLAHLQDTEYPIAGVRQETDAMIADGFPLERIEVDGDHYNEPGDMVNGHSVPGTDADLVNLLLPHIDDGWRSP